MPVIKKQPPSKQRGAVVDGAFRDSILSIQQDADESQFYGF